MIDRKTLELATFSLFLIIIISIYATSAFLRNSKWSTDLTLWEDAKLKSPSKSRPYTYTGIAYAKDDKFKEAYSNLSQAIILNPNDIEARYNLSILYMELKRFDLAEVELKRAVESRPELIDSYMALTDLYAKTNRVRDAASILSIAKKRWPGNIVIGLKLATANARSGRLKEAKEGFEWVLERSPMETEALNGLGNIYMIEREPASALSYYKRSINIRPDEPEAIYNAALVSEELGRDKEAATFYALFIKAARSDNESYKDAITRAKEKIQYLK
ncbi:MAG: tetratricopeptide repeat protein [Proteobacteria bacterium]|nr:tetratricopeptide repeat protein [Pseudomonadota bacterium]